MTFFSFLAILLIAVALMIFRVPFKVGNVEVGDYLKIVHDTITTIKVDTQFIDNNPKIAKAQLTIRPKNEDKKILVKSGDTSITVQNQAANINTGTNNGIIGNNNDVKVNVSEIQKKIE